MRNNNSIAYSDGKIVEEKIFSLLKDATELSSLCNIAQAQYANWAIRYHLSAMRGNLLRPFDFSGMDVLELGAGMGGISRILAESARYLTIVEGTEQRFQGIQERLRDLDNWEGHICNIQDFNPRKKFDVVCLIGVWEYSELYIEDVNPFLFVLQKIRNYLKEDGVVIIAIENKIGLKYFSGASEDHSARHFDGICGYAMNRSVRTFSLQEALAILKDSGFNFVQTYFPHPDYKMPKVLFSEKMLREYSTQASQILAGTQSEDYSNTHLQLFPEALAWETLAGSKLLHEMANSFLFLATHDDSSATMAKLQHAFLQGNLATGYAMDRKEPVQTFFGLDGDNIVVEKKDMHNNLIARSPFYKGKLLALLILKKMYFEGKKAAIDELVPFVNWIFLEFKDKNPQLLQNIAVDALPHNAILTKNGYKLFDLEWVSPFSVTKTWYLYRIILVLEEYFNLFSCVDDAFSFKNCYEEFCIKFSLLPNYEKDRQNELRFDEYVRGIHTTFKIENNSLIRRVGRRIKKIIAKSILP